MAFPVPPLTFVRCADVSPAAATIAGFLDAIYSALSAVNDYRGTAKPATHAWTFTQRQVLAVTNAITCEPPAALGRDRNCRAIRRSNHRRQGDALPGYELHVGVGLTVVAARSRHQHANDTSSADIRHVSAYRLCVTLGIFDHQQRYRIGACAVDL